MTVAELTAIFKEAEEAALAVENKEDGGTCNLDTPAFFSGRKIRHSVVEEAAKRAGISVYEFEWFHKKCWWVHVTMHGQANCRTRMAEAAYKVLKAHGLDAHMYYQTD